MSVMPVHYGFTLLTASALTVALGSLVLSFWVWRSDPDRDQFSASPK